MKQQSGRLAGGSVENRPDTEREDQNDQRRCDPAVDEGVLRRPAHLQPFAMNEIGDEGRRVRQQRDDAAHVHRSRKKIQTIG